MTMNFASPATTDNYSTAFVPNIQANQTAIAQMLDSTNVTITGTPPTYAKRYNRTTTYLEEYSGTTWATLPHRATDSDKLNGQLPAYYQVALGFTPYNSTNPSGYISGITSGNVVTALGFSPVQTVNGASGVVTITIPVASTVAASAVASTSAVGTSASFARADHTHSGVTSVNGNTGAVTVTSNPGTVTSITAGLGLSGGTISTSGTIALVTTAGAVGTYAFLTTTSGNNAFGTTRAGSQLYAASVSLNGSPYAYTDIVSAASAQSGTWQCMGNSVAGSASGGCGTYATIPGTLWMRIA